MDNDLTPSARINFFFQDINSFVNNTDKVVHLRSILRDPILQEALNLILSKVPPTRGASLEAYALTCAYRDGMLSVLTDLFDLVNMSEENKDYSDKSLLNSK